MPAMARTSRIEGGTCPRCNGTGRLSHYAHVAQGVCFLCGGSGKISPRTINLGDQTLGPGDGSGWGMAYGALARKPRAFIIGLLQENYLDAIKQDKARDGGVRAIPTLFAAAVTNAVAPADVQQRFNAALRKALGDEAAMGLYLEYFAQAKGIVDAERAAGKLPAAVGRRDGGKRRHAPAKPRKAPRRRATSTPKRASRLAALVASINRMTR